MFRVCFHFFSFMSLVIASVSDAVIKERGHLTSRDSFRTNGSHARAVADFNSNHDHLTDSSQGYASSLSSAPTTTRPTAPITTAMPRHSFPPPVASAPTSPAVARSKQGNPPATPQRTLQRAHHRQVSASPYTPITSLSTPYTPYSLRSFSSSNISSLATPASAAGYRHQNVPVSPEDSFRHKDRKSCADIADNWRDRASENDIKVRLSEESQFADDEGMHICASIASESNDLHGVLHVDDDCVDLDGSSFLSVDKCKPGYASASSVN